ncbi:MAG: tyrosine-protein kinase family protein [Clostridia bacterium]|nr:tyrosine-protein kinase family protein [Clostridia bacterium]
MKKVITALLNKTVNEKLKEYEEINVVMNDIQYKEGIIEALEINPEIEYIILSELLPGEILIKDLIEKIKQIKKEIKIIIILEKENKKLENYLLSKENIKIFYNNEIKIKEIAELIININKNEKLELEIKKLKEIIINKKDDLINNEEKNIINTENEILITEEEKRKIEEEIENELNNSKIKNKILNNKFIKKVISKIKKQTINNNCKIIIITGICGVGKSFFTVNISKHIAEQKRNILIIDFDFINNSIKTLFGIKSKTKEKYIEKNNIEDLIIKINSKIDLISNINLIFNENNSEDFKILKLIKDLKMKYDFIIIDINDNEQILNLIKEETHKIIFITEPNILQIKKSQNILNKYINELYVEKESIYLLFNKVKNDSISFNILKSVFKNYNIIGKINFINNYNTIINQNMKSIFFEDKIKNQYKNIAKKISQNNKIDKYYLNKIINN